MANQPPGLNGINVLGYMGVNPTTPSNYKTYDRSPTTNDSMNFKIGDHWEWQDPQRLWVLVALIGGEATWKEIVFDAANEFPTNAGIAFPLAGVLNVLGDTTSVLTSGAGNTITIETGPEVAVTYTTDDQIAVPDAGNLFVLGGPNINTEAPLNLGDELKINLNTSIQQPATTADATAGMYSLGVGTLTDTRFMYAFPETSTFLGSTAGNLTLTPGAAINNTGIGAASLNGLTTGAGNVAVGSGSLNVATTADDCTAIGTVSQSVNVDSVQNTSVGSNTLTSLTTGAGVNNAFGFGSLNDLTTGSNNCAMGGSSLTNLLTGDENIAIGHNSGDAYVGAESSNVLISNAGTVGDSNVIRIGEDGAGAGQQNACYVAGVYAGTLGATNKVTFVDDEGKLAGSTGDDGQVIIGATGGSPAWADIISSDGSIAINPGPNSIDITTAGGGATGAPFFGYFAANAANVTGNNVIYTMAGWSTLYDIGGGLSADRYTAPATGYYQFFADANVNQGANNHTSCSLSWQVNGATPQQQGYAINPVNAAFGVGNAIVFNAQCQQFLNAGDYIQALLIFGGGAQDVTVIGSASPVFSTTFQGFRIS